jgi:hypothetical protein
MRLATVIHDGVEQSAVLTAHGLTLVADINARLGKAWPTDLFALVQQGLSHAIESDAFARPPAIAIPRPFASGRSGGTRARSGASASTIATTRRI